MNYTKIIPIELAFAIKDIYHEDCRHHYNTRGRKEPYCNCPAEDWNGDALHLASAPSYAEVFDFFANNGLIITPVRARADLWYAQIYRGESVHTCEAGPSWRDAADNAIREAIRFIQ